jgi:uncharacterized Tic20 family protein
MGWGNPIGLVVVSPAGRRMIFGRFKGYEILWGDFMVSYDPDKRRLLSALCHASIFLNSAVIGVGGPIAVLLISDDPVVKANAKESLNFHFNMWLYWLIVGVLTFILVGFLLWPIAIAINFILPILAILHSFNKPDEAYRYPFIFRIL